MAVDLRRTATVLKINTELERIADLAVNIAERTSSLSRALRISRFRTSWKGCRPRRPTWSTTRSTRSSTWTSAASREVCRRDEEVDGYNRQVIDELYEMMRRGPTRSRRRLHVFSISRHVERIANCATNIAEDVIYLVEGEIARHHAVEMKPHLM